MELQLRNFRCYSNVDLKFVMGTVLLNGDSGSGKSTILEAFDYVFFGKLQKQYAHGQKSCSVKLILGPGIWIQRNSGPGKLQLEASDQKYDGEEAQGIINQMYGTRAEFLACSYLKQGERCSLMKGTNAEKMELIRAISFRDENVEEIQSKIKAHLKQLKDTMKDMENEVKIAQGLLDGFNKNNTALTKSDVDFLTIDADKLQVKLKELETKHSTKVNELHEVIGLSSKYETLRSCVKEKIADDILKKTSEEIVELTRHIDLIIQKIDNIKHQNAKIEALKELQAVKEKQEAEVTRVKGEIESLHSELQIYSAPLIDLEIDRLNQNISLRSKINTILQSCGVSNIGEIRKEQGTIASEIRTVKATLVEFEKDLENKKWNEQQSKTLVCPKCSSALHLEENALRVVSEDFKPDIKEIVNADITEAAVSSKRRAVEALESKKDKFQASLVELNGLFKDIDKESDDDNSQLAKFKKYVSLGSVLKQVESQLASLSSGSIEESPVESAETVDNLIVELNKLTKERHDLHKMIDDDKDQEKHHAELHIIKEQLNGRTKEVYEGLIKDLDDEMKSVKEKINLCKAYFQREELQESLKQKQSKQKEIGIKAHNASKLFEISKQVELKVLDQSVCYLNAEMKKYLDIMFPDDLITVEFKTIRENKTKSESKTMACSMSIFFKNHEYSNPNQLSGGEGDRISLAMMLALNTLLGSNIILLDETLNTLDRNTKISIIELLKQVVGNVKLCLVVSHEGVQGVYDGCISL